MVLFRVVIGTQVRYFEGESFEATVKEAIRAQLPVHLIKAGTFLQEAKLRVGESKALRLLESL